MPTRQTANTRSRSGCLNCRRRKRKCDERRPTCQGCVRRKEACEWGIRVTFRSRNALSLASESRRRESGICADVRPAHDAGDFTSSPNNSLGDRPLSFSTAHTSSPHDATTNSTHGFLYDGNECNDSSYSVYGASAASAVAVPSPSVSLPSTSHDSFSYGSNTSVVLTPTPSVQTTLNSLNNDNSVIATLVSLRQNARHHGKPGTGRDETQERTTEDNTEVDMTTPLPSAAYDIGSSFYTDNIQSVPQDCFPSAPSPLDDTIFWPGSAYHELHSTLRSHIIYEVRSNAPTRPCTPIAKGDSNGGSGGSGISTSNNTSGASNAVENREPTTGIIEPNTESTTSVHGPCLRSGEPTALPLEWPAHLLSDNHIPPTLSQEEEVALWTNWFDEIAPWLDKFDTQRHFQHVLPTMAQKSESLRFAMLALSARQIERKEQEKAEDEAQRIAPAEAQDSTTRRSRNGGRADRTEDTACSLALYQQAIHLLLPQLHTRATSVIAACVVLCVLEMMSCSPKAWRRHLDGCAALMQAVGCHGFVGGVEQALFWCFARMDVCGGLISSVRTLIPTGLWLGTNVSCPTGAEDQDQLDFTAGEARFQSAQARGFDMAANHAVYLMAQVLDLLYALPVAGKEHTRPAPPPVCSEAYRARWIRLWRRIENWRVQRPAELHEILSIPSPVASDASAPADASPFPTLLYSNPAAISGNQMYHTAAVLLLQNLPASLRFSHLSSLSPDPTLAPPRSILWHARQICGISLTNHHHGAWTNSIQPLWIAGRCMSHVSEHRSILALMRRIQRDSGWAAQWRADDLVEVWGD